jgi:hypothetical protein
MLLKIDNQESKLVNVITSFLNSQIWGANIKANI